MAEVRISRDLIVKAMTSQLTREALREKARKLASDADRLGRSEGVELNARVVEGTRPGGRPFANVESDNVAQEWGNRDTERRRVLGRIAEQNRSKRGDRR